MFVFTLGKSGLRRLGALAVAGVALAGVVFAAGSFFRNDDDALATAAAKPTVKAVDPAKVKIENTESIDEFFKAYGMQVDLSSATVDKVKIPKKWDESFSAFNTVVKDSGFSLEKYKGKTVEKWMLLSPERSTGEQKITGVLLVYKEQPVGAYLVAQPSGEVTGLSAVKKAEPLSTSEAAANAEFGEDALNEAQAAAAEAAAAETEAGDATEVAGITTEDFDLTGVGEFPIE